MIVRQNPGTILENAWSDLSPRSAVWPNKTKREFLAVTAVRRALDKDRMRTVDDLLP